MKDTLFLEILKYWNKLNEKEKIKYLQAFESLNAKFENRTEREIVLVDAGNVDGNSIEGEYSFKTPSIIKLDSKFSKTSAINNMSTIFHEGFHALVDDFFNRNTDLKALAQVDNEKLKDEYALKHIIYNRAKHEGVLTLFSLKYYEEKLVREETCLYLIYNLMQTCESLEDCQMLFGIYYYNIMGQLYNAKNFEQQLDAKYSPRTYDNILRLVKTFDVNLFKEHVLDSDTKNKIVSAINPNLLKHLDENYNLFIQSQQNASNQIVANRLISRMIDNVHRDFSIIQQNI